jgi:hypothetical protein
MWAKFSAPTHSKHTQIISLDVSNHSGARHFCGL